MNSRLSSDDLIARQVSRFNRKFKFYTPQINEFVIIIGAMKCGTTTLYEYLAQHPKIYRNLIQKEPEYFSKTERPDDLRGYYRQWWTPSKGRALGLDASTGYTKIPDYPDVAQRLRRLDAKKHFIYMVRDPIARIESHIAHNIASGVAPSDYAIGDLTHHISVSSYALQLNAYREAFPASPILIQDLDDLASDPLQVVRNVFEHLELEWHGIEKIPAKNTRAKDGQAASYRLPEALKSELRSALSPEMKRFSQNWNFDVEKWGF